MFSFVRKLSERKKERDEEKQEKLNKALESIEENAKRKKQKKRIFGLILVVILGVLLCWCGAQPSDPNDSASGNSETQYNSDELYDKAMSILDELNDPRIDDFRTAYDLLTNLPDKKNKFVDQLEKANPIFEKYDVKFRGSIYLSPYKSFSQEDIDEYKTQGAYSDVGNLLKTIVYPVLFDEYGDDAQHIEGLSAYGVIAAIESTGVYTLEDMDESYDGFTETWRYIGNPRCYYKIKYQNNGLVEKVEIPIVKSDTPMDDNDYTDFYAYDLAEQKRFAGERFASMIGQFNTISTGYEVLCQIYTDEELNVIFNYIKSLTIDDIWEQNMWTYSDKEEVREPNTYAVSKVAFNYKGNDVTIDYGLNYTELTIIGGDDINQFSSRWYTLYCGLILSGTYPESIPSYQNYIDFNIDYNDVVHDWSYDLDSNADKYANASVSGSDMLNKNDEAITLDKIVISWTEKITVEGVIEQNTDVFPQYRLKLNDPITIAFKEYGVDYEFACDYLYFYDKPDENGGYDFASLVGRSCAVTAILEDYRGGSELYFLEPVIEFE